MKNSKAELFISMPYNRQKKKKKNKISAVSFRNIHRTLMVTGSTVVL